MKHTLPRNTHINAVGLEWGPLPAQLYARIPERGYKKTTLERLDLKTGQRTVLIEENSNTNIENFQHWLLQKQQKIVFASERSGWRQLYSYDLNNRITSPVTSGDFVVNGVVHIDEEKALIYFMASGREANNMIYHRQLYRVNLDGKDLQLLTPEPAHHEIYFPKGGNYFVDNYSNASQPTRSVLRNIADGKIVHELSKANVNRLLEMGYRPPQTFEVTGRDGTTKIYGALWKPTHFNPDKKYPLIDHSYTGPHTHMFPRSYRTALARNNQALAELGFIVMMVDGMGSTGRSKAFRDVSYQNMGMNLKGHVLAIEQLGQQFDWIDTDRVGIFGHSAGGYDAGHAMLQFPEVYKVAVASSADHDFRMEKAWWPEMYMGWPVDEKYHEVSNITMAGNLEGKLLLVHGGLDDNVNPSATFKLAEALVDADKEFDLLVLPSQR
ncbi:MAG: prolyl oligopeptidase family serine peptidase, partial [Bacteroidota bacterium]